MQGALGADGEEGHGPATWAMAGDDQRRRNSGSGSSVAAW